ncbi:MAG: hypothetical protein JXL84_24175 [Deltaproteobacteria bacterium]|nr:hypothetical protein [Deltaproteobacteria bacterium]
MEMLKLVQTWNPIAGKKQEYAAFMTHEFQPLMKALGLDVVSGWYTLVGGMPPILVESLIASLDQAENALHDERYVEMLDRFMNLVTHYSCRIFKPAGWMTRYHWRIPTPQEVKYVQVWDVVPGEQEAHKRFVQEVHLPQMEAIELGVSAGWHLMVGSGCQVLSEALAPDLTSIAKALCDERYLRLMMRMDEVVTHYESSVMIRHQSLLDMVHRLHGRAIRAISLDVMHAMVGPMEE